MRFDQSLRELTSGGLTRVNEGCRGLTKGDEVDQSSRELTRVDESCRGLTKGDEDWPELTRVDES